MRTGVFCRRLSRRRDGPFVRLIRVCVRVFFFNLYTLTREKTVKKNLLDIFPKEKEGTNVVGVNTVIDF